MRPERTRESKSRRETIDAKTSMTAVVQKKPQVGEVEWIDCTVTDSTYGAIQHTILLRGLWVVCCPGSRND